MPDAFRVKVVFCGLNQRPSDMTEKDTSEYVFVAAIPRLSDVIQIEEKEYMVIQVILATAPMSSRLAEYNFRIAAKVYVRGDLIP